MSRSTRLLFSLLAALSLLCVLGAFGCADVDVPADGDVRGDDDDDEDDEDDEVGASFDCAAVCRANEDAIRVDGDNVDGDVCGRAALQQVDCTACRAAHIAEFNIALEDLFCVCPAAGDTLFLVADDCSTSDVPPTPETCAQREEQQQNIDRCF